VAIIKEAERGRVSPEAAAALPAPTLPVRGRAGRRAVAAPGRLAGVATEHFLELVEHVAARFIIGSALRRVNVQRRKPRFASRPPAR
jgi:hypothetical protein